MRLYFTFTRKTIAAMAAALLLGVLVIGRFSSVSAADNLPDGDTNALRVEYALSIGYHLSENDVSTKTVTIPAEFSDVYKQYNELQKKAGFDLEAFAGRDVTLYTYAVNNPSQAEKVYMNLLVSGGRIIGGDICTARIDGEMRPLIKLEG